MDIVVEFNQNFDVSSELVVRKFSGLATSTAKTNIKYRSITLPYESISSYIVTVETRPS